MENARRALSLVLPTRLKKRIWSSRVSKLKAKLRKELASTSRYSGSSHQTWRCGTEPAAHAIAFAVPTMCDGPPPRIQFLPQGNPRAALTLASPKSRILA